jgi:hypothetical protein
MKDAAFRVEFIQHVLANSEENSKQCIFRRASDDALIFQQRWWHSAFASAIDSVDDLRHIKPGDICMDLLVKAPTEMYKRHYGGKRFRVHEAIMPGTVVEFSAIVGDRVTESNLKLLLQRVGRFIGISPFGHGLGFGNFRLLDVTVQASEARRRKSDGRAIEDRR